MLYQHHKKGIKMNLELFKTLTPEQIKLCGESIPAGSTYDARGKELTRKESDGYWQEGTYDAWGNQVTYKDSSGFWSESTHDAQGKTLTYKTSAGYWEEYVRGDQGNCLTYKNSNGFYAIDGEEVTKEEFEDVIFLTKEEIEELLGHPVKIVRERQ